MDGNAGSAIEALAADVQREFVERRLTLALAESCTGGVVAAALTEIPGSSAYFVGGVVSYANEAKRDVLGVDPDALEAHGAVSAQVAREMAIRARERFSADIGASVTGIAGPDGGSPAKPVGLTYLGVADGDGVDVRRVVWSGDRRANRLASTEALLALVLERLGGSAAERSRTSADEPIRAGAPGR